MARTSDFDSANHSSNLWRAILQTRISCRERAESESPACRDVDKASCAGEAYVVNALPHFASSFGVARSCLEWYRRHMQTSRHYFNPLEYVAARGVTPAVSITFDPDVQHQYRIIRSTTHDGTAIFTDELIGEALNLLLTGASYFVPDPPNGRTPRYVVGTARLATVCGTVLLPVSATHRYPGERQRLTIPVRVEYDD